MELLFYLAIVVSFVAVVGHGLWLAITWVFRGFRSKSDRATFEPTLNEDRAATGRYVVHLYSHGLIDEELRARFMRLMAEELLSIHSGQAYLAKRSGLGGSRSDLVDPGEIIVETPKPPPIAPPAKDAVPEAIPIPNRVAEVEATPATPAVSIEPEPLQRDPRRRLSEILASFMAEKNIRWGELVGGLLIVSSSTALVMSLWSQIEAIPVLKFIIFTSMTAALFGAGLFVYHRWNLPTTGHALLAISTLLVPLNLLAFAAFSKPHSLGGGLTLGAELMAITLFGWLTLLAGRVVMPATPYLFAAGVTGLSASSQFVRFVNPNTVAALVGTALVPVGIYIIVIAASLWRHSRMRRVREEEAKAMLFQLGVQTFACLVPLGLLLHQTGQVGTTLRLLSPLMCALAGPAMVTGLFLWRRITAAASSQVRTTAASISLVAAAVMMLGAGLAWPMPSRLMPAMLINAFALVALCRLIRHPTVHAMATLWFAAAWVLGVQLVSGGLSWSTSTPNVVANALFSAGTGQALVAVVAACALIAVWFERRQRRVLALGYGVVTLGFALVSVGLVTLHGFGVPGDTEHVTWVYAVYAAGAFVAARRLGSPIATCGGCVAAQLAIVQLTVCVLPSARFALPTALLLGASACTVAAVMLRRLNGKQNVKRPFVDPFTTFAVTVSLIAILWMTVRLPSNLLSAFSIRMAWVSALWFALALTNRWPRILAGSQVALVVAACAGMQHHLCEQTWYQTLSRPLHEPWVWQAHLLVIGGLCLAWSAARVVVNKLSARTMAGVELEQSRSKRMDNWPTVVSRLLNPSFPAADRWMALLVLAGLVFLSLWGAWPSVASEHGWPWSQASFAEYAHAYGIGSWLVLTVVAATFFSRFREGLHSSAARGLFVALACSIVLITARFDERHQVVDAFRWLAAFVMVLVSAAVWTKAYWLHRVGHLIGSPNPPRADGVFGVRSLLVVLFGLPVVLLTLTFAGAIAHKNSLTPADLSDTLLRISLLGPAALMVASLIGHGVWERRSAFAVAAAGLACVVVTGVELSVHSRAGRFSSPEFSAWLVQINAMVFSVVALLWHASQGWNPPQDDAMKFPRWPLLVARAVIGVALFLVFTGVLIETQIVSAAIAKTGSAWSFFAAVVLIEWALLSACRSPLEAGNGHDANVWVIYGAALLACVVAPFDNGNWLCFHTLMVGFTAGGLLRIYLGNRQVQGLIGTGWQETFEAAAAGPSGAVSRIDHDLSCAGCNYNLRGLAPSGRCPECNAAISQSREVAVGRLTPEWTAQLTEARNQTATGVFLCAALGTLFALRAALDDPQGPWWSAAVLVGLCASCIALAGWMPRRVYAYVAGIEICLASTVWWMTLYWQNTTASLAANLANLLNVNVIALAVAGIAWLVVERRVLRRKLAAGHVGRMPIFHHTAAALSTGAVTMLAGLALYRTAIQQPANAMVLLSWLGWALATALMVACTRQPVFRHVSAGLYVLGLSAIGLVMAQSAADLHTLAWATSVALAGYVLMTTMVTNRRIGGEKGPLDASRNGSWVLYGNALTTVASVLLAEYVGLTHPSVAVRMLVVISPLLCAISAVLVTERLRTLMQTCCGALLVFAGVLMAWSYVGPYGIADGLHRAVGMFAALSTMIAASSVLLTRATLESTWKTAVRRNVAGMSVFGGAALLYIAAYEIIAYVGRHSMPLARFEIAAMIAALLVAAACCIAFAVRDRFDPFRVTPAAKETYVYVAVALLCALGLHIRAAMPWLFHGFITQYWPILVMTAACAVVAVGEACVRRGLGVLVRPLGRVGVCLPGVALLDCFLTASRVDYSVVLLTIGAFYAVMASLRRSALLGTLAALSFNGSLWYLLHHTQGLGIAQHPQLWFIPPAMAVLAAVHLNRAGLEERQRRAVHYTCLFTVYLSSTADIFLIGVAKAPWLPLVLGGLSVAGILAGIAFRMRSFLQLGTGFLCLSLLTIIWHAANNLGWTWVWYVAGIALGVAIITMFALFEKKRSEMGALFEEVRGWAE